MTKNNYFVDESGDGILFNKKGKPLFLQKGFLQNFMLGMVDLKDEVALKKDFDDLRENLLKDPYFKDVPSLDPKNKKTAIFFHAKDDLPEVRREVFKILLRHDFKFYAVIKSMKAVFEYVKNRNETYGDYKYTPNELYDLTVRMLFKDRLHLNGGCRIVFSKRGKSDRTKALEGNIEKARNTFLQKNPEIEIDSDFLIEVFDAPKRVGLQCADYCLWALQRMFERGEDRFLGLIWDKIGLIRDVDDKSKNPYGNYINSKSEKLDRMYMQKRQI